MDISKYRDNIELSDITITVGDREYKLHKFPLSINSEYFKEHCKNQSHIILKKFPGDWKYFEFIADHCYGKEVIINENNVVILLCGAEFLGMNGKYNMIEKCQKVIDRLLRSMEYSKSIDLVIQMFESSIKSENDSVQAILQKGLAGIVDLWLRPLSKFQPNFKEKYLEDNIVFGELLKVHLNWIERIIEFCSTDENKYQYIGKLAVEFIREHVIKKNHNINSETSDQIREIENDETFTKLKLYDSSSCSSINEAENSDISSSSCEKEVDKPANRQRKCVTKKNVGELFDKIIFCLPNNISLGKIVSIQWFQDCLDVCNKFHCKCKNKLLKLCGGMLTEVPIEEIKTMDPKNVTEMIEQILTDEKVDKDLMKWIWDNNFMEMANNDELDPAVFSKVVKNMPESQDVDPDVVFQIVLSILNKIGGDNTKYQSDLLDCVKLEEVSPENLEVALGSQFWNAEDVCKVAIKRLKDNPKNVTTHKKIENYIPPYGVYEDTDNDYGVHYQYRSKSPSSWKHQSFTNYHNYNQYDDDDNYSPKAFEPISSYYSSHRQIHSTYSPESYLTMEENLKYELKKISDSYISYYKDRFPLKSRRRYQYSVPRDL